MPVLRIPTLRITASFGIAMGALALAGCEAKTPSPDAPDPSAGQEDTQTPEPAPSEAVSILRADIDQPEPEAPPLEPLNAVVGFPEGGDELDEAALAALADVLASEQIALGGSIILRGHSDAGGTDAANERASLARANAVAAWLTENGIAEDRIAIIAFGEQNPIEPNALPDGSPNEEGRAINRRVEVLIVPPEAEATSTQAGD